MKQIISNILTLIAVVILIWFALSYVDILCHNLDGAQYANWNLFVKFFETSN